MKDLIIRILKEEVKNGKVTCDNCGWSWKLSEGGHDPYICHQCNHNNQPKNIQESSRIYLTNDEFEQFFPPVKKYWDQYGVNKQTIHDVKKYIIGGDVLIRKFLIEYFGKDGLLEKLRELIEDKTFFCRDCNQYFFKFKIPHIEIGKIIDNIDVDVMVSENGYGTTFNREDGEFENIRFSKLESLEGTEFYEDIIIELKNEVEEFLDKKLEELSLSVNVTNLEIYPPHWFKE